MLTVIFGFFLEKYFIYNDSITFVEGNLIKDSNNFIVV
jgi:hypothetical protein